MRKQERIKVEMKRRTNNNSTNIKQAYRIKVLDNNKTELKRKNKIEKDREDVYMRNAFLLECKKQQQSYIRV